MNNENIPSENILLPAEDDHTPEYEGVVSDIAQLLESARRQAARSVNALMTATYWLIGRRIVEFEQNGKDRAGYGEKLIERLAADLTAKFGRGFSQRNVEQMRHFYQLWQIPQTVSAELELEELAKKLPLSWSHYVKLLSVQNPNARVFYETEALRGGWSLRQLERQMNSMFYERTALSINKAAMLTKGAEARPEDVMSAEAEIKDPLVLEFLGLRNEYSENELEEALIQHLEAFLLKLGNDFTFVRQNWNAPANSSNSTKGQTNLESQSAARTVLNRL